MAALIKQLDLVLDVEHGQFFVEDERVARHHGETVERFKAHGFRAIAPAMLVVRTFRLGGKTKVMLACYDTRPDVEPNRYDRIELCSLDLSSGNLCLDSDDASVERCPIVQLPPNIYQVLVCSRGWETITDTHEREGLDAYHIILWPGDAIEPVVLHNRTPFA